MGGLLCFVGEARQVKLMSDGDGLGWTVSVLAKNQVRLAEPGTRDGRECVVSHRTFSGHAIPGIRIDLCSLRYGDNAWVWKPLGQGPSDFQAESQQLALYGPLDRNTRGLARAPKPTADCMTCANNGGPGWDRTSDLPRVKRTLSH